MGESRLVEAERTGRGLSAGDVDLWRERFDADSAHARMQNAVTRTAIDDVALNRSVVTSTDHTFSHVLDDWSVTSQNKSGRCWMFAGLNLLRVGAMKKMNLSSFEFSQSYTFFWDKLERSNYFLEQVVQTADRPIDDRVVAYLFRQPLNDGGQWNMFVNLVKKYGLVPKAVMPESESSSNSMRMNANLSSLLREGAASLRTLVNSGQKEAVRARKQAILGDVYRVLSIHLGTPPRSFDWRWNDKDKQFHSDGQMTPQAFAEKYCTVDLDDYLCLVHDPRPTSPTGSAFTVAHLGNVLGGDFDGGVRYINVEIELMKQLTMRSITERSEPVWMGCDVGKMMHRGLGLWDPALFDYAGVYGVEFVHDKSERLLHHQTLMTHAMMFTGVDVEAGQPRRWRVENSWGEDNGVKGFYTMNDEWFDEYMFEVAIHKDLLPAEIIDAAKSEPIVLPPWDPMGALAGG